MPEPLQAPEQQLPETAWAQTNVIPTLHTQRTTVGPSPMTVDRYLTSLRPARMPVSPTSRARSLTSSGPWPKVSQSVPWPTSARLPISVR
ncbi:hypothetical protein CIK61_14350 [Brevibacterium aurantiacum]|nr:hypothetical protein CIK63_05415 [Brevibacterium aurantiacum]RCS93621.1 hypothetical protein CIK61_14350 [Brevibacterium aurantiacum]